MKNKHVFVIGDNDKFFFLQADALINKVGVEESNICAVVLRYSSNDTFDELKKVRGVSYIKFNDALLSDFVNAKTVTVMSLLRKNSGVVRSIIEYDRTILSRLYIFITDDEVNRWNTVFLREKKIVSDNKLLISPDDIFVLNEVENFIAPQITFEPLITKLLDRSVNYINSGIIFDTLDYESHQYLKSLFSLNENISTNYKILYGSKGIKRNDLKALISLWVNLLKNISLLKPEVSLSFVFITKNSRIIFFIEILRVLLNLINKRKTNVDYIAPSDPLTYTSLILSCSHFVLQGRGGASTARTYVKLARGILCIKNKTHNHTFFKDDYKIDSINYTTSKELALKIVNSNIDLINNSQILKMNELDSIKLLKKLYQ